MWRRRVELMSIAAVMVLLAAIIVPAIQQARESARRTQSKNNLRQIGLALHNYHDQYRCLPPGGIFDKSGRGQIGWMLSLMPYMDASPIYSRIDFDQAWDSPRNAGELLKISQDFQIPGEPERTVHWEFPLAHYSANSHLLGPNSSVDFDSDGTSSSQMFAVAELGGDFVPWPCPYNWRPLATLNGQPRTYGRYSGDGAFFLFVDGHVEFVSNAGLSSIRQRLTGPDLTSKTTGPPVVQPRPARFPVPKDALEPDWLGLEGTDSVRVISGLRDYRGNLVSLTNRDGFSKRRPVSIEDRDLLKISKQTHVEDLNLTGDFTDSGLVRLQSLTRLRNLQLESDSMTEDALQLAIRLPELRTLHIAGKQILPETRNRFRAKLPNCDIFPED